MSAHGPAPLPPETGLALALRDIEVRYAGLERPALAIAMLDLPAGEQVALTGPSGSGKTTFLNILTGMERVNAGTVRWRDTDLSSLTESARDRWRATHVGLVMQDFHLFPGLSALDNALLPQRLSRLRLPTESRVRALELLARVGITRPEQPVETMSRGQMQRVAVARALVGAPALLVADEPTASLDDASGAAVADLLLELAGEAGATLIIATHDAGLVARLPRHLALDGGRLKD